MLDVRNPARPSETVASHEETAPDALDGILAAARGAQGDWAQVPQPERGREVGRWLDALEERAEEIAASVTAEMGKTLTESRGELAKGIAEGRMGVARAAAPTGEVMPSQVPGTVVHTIRRPRGVIAGINPWNFPFSTPTRKAVPALVHGNAIVLKPASIAPGAVVAMVAAGEGIFPEGLLSCILGGGALGQALAEHPGVDAVSFTGSVAVGKRVAAAASSHLAEISLELGGNNPAVLNDASDLDAALDQIAAAAMAVTGQRCTALSRVIVRAELAEAVTEGLARRLSAIEPMDGTVGGATMGSLASRQQLEDVAGFVERARADGARIVTGGERIETETGGYFYAPTLVADVAPEMEIAREEVFGPVLVVLTYRDLDEAMRIANGVEFGLASCLYSEQAPVIERFLAESESGMLHVNAGTFPENHTPFVGVKASAMGVGGSNGPSTVQFYTTEHTIYRRGAV